MTVQDLIGRAGEDVTFEGAQIFEFLTMLKMLPVRQHLDFYRLERATRITGTELRSIRKPRGEVFGQVCGRTWTAEYRGLFNPVADVRKQYYGSPRRREILLAFIEEMAATGEYSKENAAQAREWVERTRVKPVVG